jgi:hypothetical protein
VLPAATGQASQAWPWATPLLEGYPWTQVPNRSRCLGSNHFFGLFNPGLWALIRDGHFDGLLICGYYFASAWIAVWAAKWFGVFFTFVSDSHSLQSWKTRLRSPFRNSA